MRYIVAGSGVAGVCCLRALTERLQPGDEVAIVTPGDAVKSVENVERVTRKVEVFDVVERPLEWLSQPGVRLVPGLVTGVDERRKLLLVRNRDDCVTELPYDRLCIAVGARPRTLPQAAACGAADRVVTLRDTDSVSVLSHRLRDARRVMVAGNGGIAMELIETLSRLQHELVWVVRHEGIGDAFFDRDAAAFLQSVLIARASSVSSSASTGTAQAGEARAVEPHPPRPDPPLACDAAVGPAWTSMLAYQAGAAQSRGVTPGVRIEMGCEVEGLESRRDDEDPSNPPLRVRLTSGEEFSVDVVVVAAGVVPSVEWAPAAWLRDADGGLCVDHHLRVIGSDGDVFAVGDCASMSEWRQPNWHQIRLWSQARLSGTFAAACMAGVSQVELDLDSSFELFAHTTTFFGQRVVLLGRYNAQGIDAEHSSCVSYSRQTPPGPNGCGGCFVRLLLVDGRLRGAVLIGEEACELCETYEHLILDELDLSEYGANLLDMDEDYWD